MTMYLFDLRAQPRDEFLDQGLGAVDEPSDLVVPFEQLDGDPPNRVGSVKFIDGFLKLFYPPFDLGSVENGGRRLPPILGNLDYDPHQGVDAYALHRHHRDHRDSQLLRQLSRFDVYPLALRDVHLVKGYDHPRFEFEELDGEEEVPL
ncbi:hypothetical protein ES703_83077 [subsurface metagenome]